MLTKNSSFRSIRLAAIIVTSAALVTSPLVIDSGTSPLLPQAQAIPDGGAGPNTPGTSSDVWPKRIQPCERLNYKVSGYPAGETLNIKVDDGVGYSDTSTHGAGVVAQQGIRGDGTAQGSVDIPCNIGPGTHWLRFLASSEAGLEGGGYLGFTNRSPNFSIEGAGSDSSGGGNSGGNSGGGNSGGGGRSSGGGNSGGNSGGGEKVETVVVGGGRGGSGSTVQTRVIEEGGSRGSNRGAAVQRGATASGGNRGNAKNSLGTRSDGNGNAIENASGGGGITEVILSDDEDRNAPVIGMIVGGSILLVGLLGIGAYLFVNRGRRTNE